MQSRRRDANVLPKFANAKRAEMFVVTRYLVAAVVSAVSISLIPGCGKKEAPATTGRTAAEYVCTLAPSQSKFVNSLAASGGSVSAAIYGLSNALGMTAVSHSSGALLLTGSSGYIAGTIGPATAAGVYVVSIGAIIGGAAVTIELVCAGVNHPETTQRVYEAGVAFVQRTRLQTGDLLTKATPAAVQIREVVAKTGNDALKYAYRVLN
jgi:hypothetical protein